MLTMLPTTVRSTVYMENLTSIPILKGARSEVRERASKRKEITKLAPVWLAVPISYPSMKFVEHGYKTNCFSALLFFCSTMTIY